MDDLSIKEQVEFLKSQLAQSDQELKFAHDQINCLLVLVKNALCGDTAALRHLSQIAGVSKPASLDQPSVERSFDDSEDAVKVKAVKNWTILTSSLLHKDYNKKMSVLREDALSQLSQRALYLDEVAYTSTHDRMNLYLTRKNRPSSGLIKPDHVNSGLKRTNTPTVAGVKTEDFFVAEADSRTKDHTAMANLHSMAGSQVEADSRPLSYNDPKRYQEPGLFDHSTLVNRTRPSSSKSVVDGDRRRSRPKSSIVNERPLKYETTRPATVRKKSGDPRTRKQPQTADKEDTTTKKVNDAIHNFSEELKKMGDMELQFKTTTLNLQRKIGIRPDGFIAP